HVKPLYMLKSTPESYLENDNSYHSLSLEDLIEARDLFHVHLMNKKNVVATAVGRYRIRKDEPRPHQEVYLDAVQKKNKGKRTLDNSEVRDYSWPCVLVFVKDWIEYDEFEDTKSGGVDLQDFIPKRIYMPNGRIVPICVVQATKDDYVEEYVDPSRIVFPTNLV